MDPSLINKLHLQKGRNILVINAPEAYLDRIKPLSPGINLDLKPEGQKYDFVHLFVENKSVLESCTSDLIHAINNDTILWVSYPKKGGGINTDINRDKGWDELRKHQLEGVSQVSIDEVWSALRFKFKDQIISPGRTAAAKEAADIKIFEATIEKAGGENMDAAYISIPFNVKEVYGTKGQVTIKAKFDGHPYQGSLANMGTGSHILIVTKDVRETIKKSIGDTVKVELEQDKSKREVIVPADLLDLLKQYQDALKFFEGLSYTNRKEYVGWIESAKKSATRQDRINRTLEKLLVGLKNPSQKR